MQKMKEKRFSRGNLHKKWTNSCERNKKQTELAAKRGPLSNMSCFCVYKYFLL